MQEARLKDVRVGVVMTGSHCTMGEVLPQIQRLQQEGAKIFPILSYTVDEVDNRFYQVKDLKAFLQSVTDQPIINTIPGAEPIGPKKMLDILIVIPATGNTVAKMANGITDTPALMAIKAHLRNQRPIVIAIATNDALGVNARNLGALLNMKHIFFVPFAQDDPQGKATSLVARMELVVETAICALQGKQIQPLVLGPA